MEKIKKLNIITGIVLAGFIIAVVYHYILGNIFHLDYPYNTFLFNPKVRFSDFTINMYSIFRTNEFNPYNQNWAYVNYFPFGVWIQYLFTKIPLLLSFLIFMITSIVYYGIYNYKNIKSILPTNYNFNIITSFFVISFLSYPFLIWFDRANFEILIFLFVSLFAYFFAKEKYLISALILSIPIAIKGFPLIFLILFLKKLKFKEIFYCLSVVFLLTFLSFLLMKGDLLTNLICYSNQLKLYMDDYAIHNNGLGFGSSLFGIVKFIIFWLNGCFKSFVINDYFFGFTSFVYVCGSQIFDFINKALTIFNPISMLLSLAIFCYVFFIEKELWKQILLIVICSIIFMPVSGDYKLLHLLIPMWLFLNSQIKSKTDLIYTILFGLILIPKNYLQFVDPNIPNSFFSISIVINPVILSVMTLIIIIEGFYTVQKKSSVTNIKN